ncbi:MAG: hypothetical protein J5848_07280 [Bacteroidales bacterium]|nr:hypothetical protein [Bacteroidales bacterium]
MRYRIIVLTLLCLGFYCNAQNKIDNQGRRQGHWIKTDRDGSRIFEGDFQDGKEIGVFKYYYPDGTLKIRNTFTIPGRYCSHEAFDEKGRLIATGFFNQKNRDSVWHFYNEEGRVVKIASYRMGIKQGTHIVFTATGDTAEISTWNDNKRHGRWWKRIGERGWICGHYENGLMQGRLVEYDDNGRLCREGFYKDGQKDGIYRYYEEGIMTVDEKWVNGALADRKILLHAPQDKWISIFSIAYYMPKGSNGSIVYLNDGSKLNCTEQLDIISNRIGSESFVIVDKRNRVISSISSINGIKLDNEGRKILDLSPTPPFTIFPDEECIRMVESLQRVDELDQ